MTRFTARSRAVGVTLAYLISSLPGLAQGQATKPPAAKLSDDSRHGGTQTASPKEAAVHTAPPPTKAPDPANRDPSALDSKTPVSPSPQSKRVGSTPEGTEPDATQAAPGPVPASAAAAERTQPTSIETCFEAFEQSQVHLKEDDLLQAIQLAEQCSQGCPEEITTECRALRSQVERDMPTALLLARTERGTDAPGVVVHIDGEQRRGVLGEELPLNPGPHSIIFSRSDGFKESVDIVVRRSEKRRQIRVVVPDLHAEPKPEASDLTAPSGRKSLQPWAIGAFSLGAAGIATMTVAGVVALNRKSNLDEDCSGNRCEADSVEQRTETIRTWLVVGDVGLAVGIVGIAAGSGLLIWEAASKKNSPRAQITFRPAWGGACGQINGSF